MGRPRTFNWNEAARLYHQHRSFAEVGRILGVSGQSVRYALRREEREYHSRYQRETRPWVGECPRCGGPATKDRPGVRRSGLCMACSALERSVTVRDDTLLCSCCGLWLPDDDFPRQAAKLSRRGRHAVCRPCQTISRRDRRAANREADRAYQREYKRRSRAAETA